MPHLCGRRGGTSQLSAFVRYRSYRRHGGKHTQHSRAQCASHGAQTHYFRSPIRLLGMRKIGQLRVARFGYQIWHTRHSLSGRKINLSQRYFAIHYTRYRQMHHVSPLRNDVQRCADCGCIVGHKSWFQLGCCACFRNGPRKIALHLLRTMRISLSHRRPHRSGPLQRCVACTFQRKENSNCANSACRACSIGRRVWS